MRNIYISFTEAGGLREVIAAYRGRADFENVLVEGAMRYCQNDSGPRAGASVDEMCEYAGRNDLYPHGLGLRGPCYAARISAKEARARIRAGAKEV